MIFDHKESAYLKLMSDDELLERLETRPKIMLACFDGRGVLAAAAHLAKSVYRVARELEHRGYDPLAISKSDPFDICACGDFRKEHFFNKKCMMNGPGHRGKPDCLEFELSIAVTDEAWGQQ